ncbi:MAG TPA: ammonia channel protein [Chloroflexi bacterium]|jgi:Amt family ammonium transporter|nr:ammonia channel protein [Chloroflexota bacterium]HAL28303.1 ammonia channel protein [Chloroflexota bacterium]
MDSNSGDTAWLLVCAALVMLMTPALGFFYGGLVGKKNVLSTLTHSFFILCLISVQWVLWGYSLSFSPDTGAGLIGGLGWVALKGVGFTPNADYAATVPHQAFMAFQMMFAVITPALITGAFAERVSFKAYVIFALVWSTLVYDPIAHWVWGTGGWLHALGTLDFAGGTVVHISSGVSALVAAILIGRRLKTSEPHDATMTILGASLLWFGWFGFNAGSALTAGGLATSAFVVTNTAAAMAGLTWLTVSWIHRGRPSVLGMAAGAVAGLVAITPASGFVDVSGSIIIGLGAGVFCYLAIQLRPRLKIDDALDVWAVHGIGGTWGAIATGLFATVAINTAGANGLFFGNPQQLVTQLIAVGATWLYAAIATAVIVKVIDVTVGMRVREHEESLGLDASQHGEIAYQLD